MYIIYLSKNRDKPSNLEDYKYFIEDDYLYEENTNTQKIKKAKYIKLHYESDILQWLNLCQKEVYNITNLNEAINTYKQIVEKITNQYKRKGVSMSEFLIKNENYIQDAFILKNNFHLMMGEVVFKLFQDLTLFVTKELQLVNIDSQISKKQIIYNKEKCKNWFSKTTNRKNIGTFFKLNENFLLFFWLGEYNFHIGITPYEEKNNQIEFINKTTINIENLTNNGQWCELFHSYTINYGNFRNNYNPNLQNISKLKNDIQEIIKNSF